MAGAAPDFQTVQQQSAQAPTAPHPEPPGHRRLLESLKRRLDSRNVGPYRRAVSSGQSGAIDDARILYGLRSRIPGA